MSVLFRRNEPPVEKRAIRITDYLPAADWNRGGSGVFVDNDSAMRHDAVWSCITAKAEDVSMLPVDVVRYTTNGERQEVSPVPQIIAAPSAFTDAQDWRYQVVFSWLSWGNAWGIVTKTTPDYRYPTRIELQNPATVAYYVNTDGELEFYVGTEKHDLWPLGDLWHEPAYTLPGSVIGLSPIQYHAASIGVGIAASNFGGGFFGGGGHPSGILTTETDPGPDAAKSLKQRFLDITRGNREPIVLPKSVKYEQIQVNPSDSQFIETMKYSVEQVCRIFREDVADHNGSAGGGTVTYANRSDADLARYRKGRQFWVTKLQNATTKLLPQPQVVRLNTSALLMMTAKERWEIHDLRLKNKTRSVNGVLKVEDEKPFDGDEFDKPGIPGGAEAPMPAEAET